MAEAARLGATERDQKAREALSCARRLRRERLPLATALAPTLEAGAANLIGDHERAISELRRALVCFEELETMLIASGVKRCLGEAIGGDEGAALVAGADSWMAEQGVVNPARLAALLVPGWRHPG